MPKPVALVTGASVGIGAAFARALARDGHDLILVARREEALRHVADEVRDRHGARAEVVPMDLSTHDAPAALLNAAHGLGMPVDLLVNNAGFGLFGPFAEADPVRVVQMLELNMVSLTALTHAFLGPMRTRRRGAIINVASVAGFQGIPNFAAYAASKAYVLAFSEGLAEEVRADGVKVQVLCPGTTKTEFFQVAGMPPEARTHFMTPEAVVEASLKGLARDQVVVVPGAQNRLAAHGGRLLPRALLTKLAGIAVRNH
jgi:hypothetical protein